ncbi:hypothetical protein [Solidesulfovibrio sp.]|uniref:hypothetical protein n=1 Tax=Solidesulfovibrio sp. TaxID=2910990 RepID=UPI002B1EB297|nr:hypothetical protein [Solidesulfovibrio sp.]MEA5089863.1 hypothetical protein [Solidesulfovibrio sp.]
MHTFFCCIAVCLLGLSGLPPTSFAASPSSPSDADAKAQVAAAYQLLETASADPAKARAAAACLEAAYAAGDPGAAAARGQLALSGLSEPAGRSDPTLALHWFAKAAAAGSPQGDLGMGLALLLGEGAQQDHYWAYWRLVRARLRPGLTPEEAKRAAVAAEMAAKSITQAERAAIEANLAGAGTK